jgi:hypothetical protein
MTQHSRQTAPTQFVPAAGVRFAYRRFGKSGGVPLVFNQHFTGTMDHWDPAVTDGLPGIAKILFNNAGRLQQLWRGADLVRGNERRRGFHQGAGTHEVDVRGFSRRSFRFGRDWPSFAPIPMTSKG